MDSLTNRYATALLNIAKEEQNVLGYKNALLELVNLFKSDEQIISYLGSYFVDFEEKCLFIDKVSQIYKLPSLTSFLKVLSKKHRSNHFISIAKEFIKMANDELGVIEGIIYSSEALTNEQIKKIEEAMFEREKRKVELKNLVDQSLIGGVKIIIDDKIYDGSIKNKLETMKSTLLKRSKTYEQ